MAAVTTKKLGGTSGIARGQRSIDVITFEVKIEDFLANGGATTDYWEVMTIPANTFLEVLQLENVTALSMGSGPAVSLGDAGSATRFVNAASTLTAGTDHTIATASLFYGSAGSLRLTLTGGTLASGTIRGVLRLTDTSRNARATS